jgi:hypothetical protein
LEYTIKRELFYILGTIENQLGELAKSVRGDEAKRVYLYGDIEKIISEKLAKLTDTQRYNVAEAVQVQRISRNF